MDKRTPMVADGLWKGHTDISTGNAAKQLVTAFAYGDGVSVQPRSARDELPRPTVHYWLNRCEESPIEAAMQVEDRPGSPPTLTRAMRTRWRAVVAQSPRKNGIDGASWPPKIIQKHSTENKVFSILLARHDGYFGIGTPNR